VVETNMPRIVADIVGPVCESGDFLARDRSIQGVKEGDLLAVMTAGAYGAAMSSTYNSRPLIPEVLAEGSRWAIVRPRPSIQQLIELDRVPEWL
jgi:diaminopimelate decarboxylase